MKNIFLLHTGGTFGMSPIEPSMTLKPGNIQDDIEKYLPDIKDIADIKIQVPFNKDSSDIGPADWKILTDLIHKNADNYDGFVIIHGTDTIVYTAAALSFVLNIGRKPVILTGSQRPLSSIRSDARGNLINSIELATYAIPEVGICFGNKLFRGNRTKKISIESYQSFDSPNYPPLAQIGLNIQLAKKNFWDQSRKEIFNPLFDNQFRVITVYPGLDPSLYEHVFNSNIKSVIIEAYGAGNLPVSEPNWIPFISKLKKSGKSVFIISQSAHGKVDLDLYECGRQAQEAGAISLRDITLEAAIVKLMILQAIENNQNKIDEMMIHSYSGEITEKED
jgi:L-asparaginase